MNYLRWFSVLLFNFKSYSVKDALCSSVPCCSMLNLSIRPFTSWMLSLKLWLSVAALASIAAYRRARSSLAADSLVLRMSFWSSKVRFTSALEVSVRLFMASISLTSVTMAS